ncbi:non-lysosomal glucosylceramidase-like isoform X1 [Mytilus californianus]|uniref:non-lysosomal glucosylceramidase-like isoform X1 n=1 Tax=Mytilus californianus TaxID=6549 RepID=UPI002247CB2F|nr:non-lysosomal glucosylceramidase-like isoform X1 [Mytilus californianus]
MPKPQQIDHTPEASITTPKEDIANVPKFGWRVNFDHECKDKCDPFVKPRLTHIPELIGLSYRYMKVWIKHKRQGRIMFIDHLNQVTHKPIYGCPIGGIGCGTIGRGYRGEFCRFQMVPGIYEHTIVPANSFILCIRKNNKTVYQKVLTGGKGKHLKSWEWGFPRQNATYHALYPRSWTVYDIPEFNLKLTCRQISPIFPNDYKDTSFPMAVFVWSVENMGQESLDISITFTFKNGRGVKEDCNPGNWTEPFESEAEGQKVVGMMIRQNIRDMKCTYGIAGAFKTGVDVSTKSQFNPKGSGQDLWEDLSDDGKLKSATDQNKDQPIVNCKTLYSVMLKVLLNILQFLLNLVLPSKERSASTGKGSEIGSAVCLYTTVKPGDKEDLEFTLTWDMPVVHFKARKHKYLRRYARWFGSSGDACPQLCSYALKNYPMWETKIEEWQNPILSNKNLPSWYKSALFNELYFVSDGGSLWLDMAEEKDGQIQRKISPTEPEVIQEYGKFGYLEGHEYRMINTYDVHHYASFAFIMLWPKIQLSIQYDMATAVMSEDTTPIVFCMEGNRGIYKTKNAVPHDLGDPEDEPWDKVNAYIVHPTHDWKDLNLKFILQTYRDYSQTKDTDYLKDMYTVCQAVMEHARQWDTDGDGLIENGGYADQTFDAWTMTGVSAYCGGLWLAALKMYIEISRIVGNTEEMKKYTEILDKGKEAFDKKLWNGSYYNYDSSTTSGHDDSVMADQLAGHWFLRASGMEDATIFPPTHVKTALKTIFKNNVMGFENGNMGAINGTRPDGKMDMSSVQSEEFWVGVTYALAANMIQEGMLDEAFQTAWGAYHTCWETYGLQFQTPEAYMLDRNYRSLGYMRPLCVWAMQWALEKFHPQLMKS